MTWSSGDKPSRIRAMAGKFSGSRGHAVASSTLAAGYVAQLGCQMGYFVILTRMLGAESFGRFAAVLAAIALASPLAGLGYGEVALVRVSEDRQRSATWIVNATFITAVMGILVAIFLAIAGAIWSSDQWLPWSLILGFAVCELVFVRSCHVIARVHQARREVSRTSAINVSIAAAKMSIAAMLLITGIKSLALLAGLLNVAAAGLLAYFFIKALRLTGTETVCRSLLSSEVRLAGSFAVGVVSKAVYTDLDKVLLAKWTTAEVVGTYAAGYKILSLSLMPMRALLEATFPRQVELAKQNRHQCLTFTFKLLAFNMLMGAVIAICIFLLAPFSVLVLGEDFANSVEVLKWGFALPLLQAIHYTLGNHLTAIGYQTIRSAMQITILISYVIAGLIFIPMYSWRGAIGTSLGCEFLLAVLFTSSLVYVHHKKTTS